MQRSNRLSARRVGVTSWFHHDPQDLYEPIGASGTAEDIARMIALMTAALAIATTVLMAGLSHQAMAPILDGLGASVGRDVGTSGRLPRRLELLSNPPPARHFRSQPTRLKGTRNGKKGE